MMDNRYNISLFSNYSICNFFEKLGGNVPVSEMKAMYDEFYKSHISEINESANYILGGKSLNECISTIGMNVLNEDFSIDDLESAFNGVEKNGGVSDSYGTRGIKNTEIKIKPTDSEEEKAEKVQKVFSQLDDTDSMRSVDNKPDDPTSLYDIHYIIDLFYALLMDGQFKIMKNTDKDLPFCILDTSNVKDFRAVFAFKDLPNIDLSLWDVSNGIKFDGCFYKSTFNNASIKNWRLKNADSVKNMFVGSNMTHQEVIDTWKQTKGPSLVTVPSLNLKSVDKAEEKKSILVQNIIGDEETYVAQLKKRMENIKKHKMAQDNFSESRKHRVMSSEEFINEGFRETISSVGKGIQNAMITLKNGFKAIIDKTGTFLRANLFENIIKFVKEKLKGKVYAGYAGSINYPAKAGYYDDIEPDSDEFNKYGYFMTQLANGSMNESLEVNERRVGLSNIENVDGQRYVNIDAPNWNTKQLRSYIEDILRTVQSEGYVDPEDNPALVVWGAPGIGKTAIAETMIDVINEDAKSDADKMGCIVVDCTNLGVGDMSMPMPVKNADVAKAIAGNAEATRLAKQFGLSEEDYGDIELAKSSDAPKTWLPVYKPTGDAKKDAVLDALANGAVIQTFDEKNRPTGYTKTGNGGVLIFDEMFRTNKENLMIIAQLMKDRRTMGGYVLGSKWYVMACSNRPTDDTDVARKFPEASDALKSRPQHCNFVPTFGEWKEWASTKGGFDEWTLNWIGENTNKRWHNIDPEKSRSGNQVRLICPRSWSQVIKKINKYCDRNGIKDHNYSKMPKSMFKQFLEAKLPDDLVKQYMEEYPKEGGANVKWTYDYIINHPDEKVTDGTTSITISDRLKKGIINNYDAVNKIPYNVIKNIVDFMEKNFPDASNETIFLLCATLKLCSIKPTDADSQPYYELFKDFSKRHPGIDALTQLKTATFNS